MPSKTVQDSLYRATRQHRLVFWYDADRSWADEFDHFTAPDVEKLKVDGTEFGAKVHITRTARPEQRFLVYLPHARALQDSDNWLLDLLLQGHEFKADKVSLTLQDLGLPYEYKELIGQHLDFFRAPKRTQALRERLTVGDLGPAIRLKMMSVLANSAPAIDELLLHLFSKGPDNAATDPVRDAFGTANLEGPFWKDVGRLYAYAGAAPSLLDFAVFLFSAANPLDGKVPLRADTQVFLQRWKDSREHADTFRAWSAAMQRRLHIVNALEAHGDDVDLADCDTFEVFDKFVIKRLCAAFARNVSATELRASVAQRRATFWRDEHADGYAALDQAIALRALLAAVDLSVGSIDEGLTRYTTTWWRIDQAYRRCVWHLRRYNQTKVMDPVSTWVERNYVNNFLLPLADRWGDQVVQLAAWKCDTLLPQRQFFDHYVQPFLAKKQTVFVVVSDALRYEAAAEFAAVLTSENRWSADIEAVLGSLPSYTQLGMAALMPGKPLGLDPSTGQAMIGGRNATGTANRGVILSDACAGRATVLNAEEFRRMNSKTDGRDLMRDHDVVYIMHNVIDKTGDDLHTEADAFDAVHEAFSDLRDILKKIANINGSNMLLTADHGFLFQQDDVPDDDLLPYPVGVDWTYQTRRFALSLTAPTGRGVKSFTAKQLGVEGDWLATFPLSLGRFPRQGSGKRFVHGAFSLQEVVVPVVRVRKARTDDTEVVEVDLQRVPNRITTGQISLSLLQTVPVGGKMLGRTLRIAVFAGNEQLSDAKSVTFDSADAEPRNREVTLMLTMSGKADAFNNRDIQIRLDEETSPGSGHYATYRHHNVRLQKPFAKDFDD